MMNLPTHFDADLLQRYDRPGPRYTSYPTAPQFQPGFGERQFMEHISASNDDPIPRALSLYAHVPFCFSPCFYCGCNRIITHDRQRGERYLQRLVREISRIAPLFDSDRQVVQLHLGGGTPNFLEVAQLEALWEQLDRRFKLADTADRDFSIELDPRYCDSDYVTGLARLGFNRISVGVQDFDATVQEAVNRIQSVEQTRAVLDAARAGGMRSVNIDLIYGLPRQSREGFSRTLDTVIDMRPDRIAVYSYAHLPELFRPQKQIQASDLPDAKTKLSLLETAVHKLGEAGYRYIGMDHFALPFDELSRAQQRGDLHRNFMGYTTHADCDLIGLGVSAISRVGDCYAQNQRTLPAWETAVDAGHIPIWRGLELDADDRLRGDLIQRLMCQGRLNFRALGDVHDVDFPDYFAEELRELAPLADDGLVELDGDSLQVTPRGRLLMRHVAMCFDRYLRQPEQPARYSRAI